jgi:hypothetical protein
MECAKLQKKISSQDSWYPAQESNRIPPRQKSGNSRLDQDTNYSGQNSERRESHRAIWLARRISRESLRVIDISTCIRDYRRGMDWKLDVLTTLT